jgi:YggT family protein
MASMQGIVAKLPSVNTHGPIRYIAAHTEGSRARLAAGQALVARPPCPGGRGAPPQAVPAIDYLAEMDSTTAQTLIYVLKPTLSVYTLLMIVRIVMTWSPEISGEAFPWSVAYKTTEGLLDKTRKVVKPFNGLDVSPIVWVAILSFLSEVLTGPQGILSLISRKGL